MKLAFSLSLLFLTLAIYLINSAEAGVIKDRIQHGPLGEALKSYQKPGYILVPYYDTCGEGLKDLLGTVALAFGDIWGANGYHTVSYTFYEVIAYKIPAIMKACGAKKEQ